MIKQLLLSIVLIGASCSMARAQSTDSLIPQRHDLSFALGREFWYAAQSNYWGVDLGGKYIRLYISSTKNTTAYVEVLGKIDTLKVTAGKASTYVVSDSAEMESSGVVEDKAIHVWSNDAELTCYNMSHNPYTSDGEYIIPTIGWGTDYVVAAYGSLFEGFGAYSYDLPSTMALVAEEDNTSVAITPSCNCRQCTGGTSSGNANSTVIVYSAGDTYHFTLNRGQSLQMMPVKATNTGDFDMTGTIVHADQPIGLMGGSVCPNIPSDFAYCDHVEDMTPPVRTWGTTYYASNTLQPPGETDKDAARYLFISSQPNQTIYRSECGASSSIDCTIQSQYGIYWDEQPGTQKFFSSAPFLVVQYLNSATYPDGNNGLGDPAESHVNPEEQFITTVEFQTPQSVGNITPYTNYAQVVVNASDAGKTLFDGNRISGYSSDCFDNEWEVFNIPKLSPGPRWHNRR